MKIIILKNYIVFLLLCLTGLGCEKEQGVDCDESGSVEISDFFDINTQYAWIQNVNENESTVNLVIRNQQDYEKYVGISTDTLRPEINFEKYVLLAGRVIHPSCGFVEDQNVKQACNTYFYNVNIGNGICGAVVKVNYFMIVSNTNTKVEFNISF